MLTIFCSNKARAIGNVSWRTLDGLVEIPPTRQEASILAPRVPTTLRVLPMSTTCTAPGKPAITVLAPARGIRKNILQKPRRRRMMKPNKHLLPCRDDLFTANCLIFFIWEEIRRAWAFGGPLFSPASWEDRRIRPRWKSLQCGCGVPWSKEAAASNWPVFATVVIDSPLAWFPFTSLRAPGSALRARAHYSNGGAGSGMHTVCPTMDSYARNLGLPKQT